MKRNTKRLYSFNEFRLETVERVLLRSGQPVPVPPKVLEVLVELVENHGHIVEKEELLKRVWPETFVEESAVAQSIFTLRKYLGDTPDGHAYIETVPRRGYRFVAPVEGPEDELVAGPGAPPERMTLVHQDFFRLRRIAAAGLVLVLMVAAYFAWRRGENRVRVPSGKIMLAVLPFQNLSGDPAQAYFSDGFTEEMITQLGRLHPERLGVIARTSTMQYQTSPKRADEIGRELGVDYILKGSVRRAGDHVRISAQLIQMKDQTNLWAQNYDRDLRDVLALQSDVARAIAREIELNLTPQQQNRLASSSAVNPEAYELYLKGRYFWNKRSEDGFVKAIEYFEKAIVHDPKYAQPYAGLADAYALLGSMPNREMTRREAMPKAKAAALKALQLSDSLAEAHTSLAFVMMHYEWDWPGSEKEFKRALELNPNYATAHQWYAVWLMAQGKTAAALEEGRRAQEADPLSSIIQTDAAQLLLYSGHRDEATRQARRALELDPDFSLAHIFLGESYDEKQDYRAAIAEFQKTLAISKDNPWALSRLARTYARAGQRSKSETILQDMLKVAKNRADLAISVAIVYAGLGENDQAFAWLEKAYQRRDGALILLNATPDFRSLRHDPRFDDLAQRVGVSRTIKQ